jgi:hypothetical protein
MTLLYASSHHKEGTIYSWAKKKSCICEGSTAERCKPVVLTHCHSHIKYKAKQPNMEAKTVPLLTCSRLEPGSILSQDTDRPF